MTERPILFSAPMVLALREGRKTQTRRTRGLGKINAEPDAWEYRGLDEEDGMHLWHHIGNPACFTIRCPYGVAGDRLWVRESFAIHAVRRDEFGIGFRADHPSGDLSKTDGGYNFRRFSDIPEEAGLQWNWAQIHRGGERWRPSIHMPRWASRDTLEVISARPERLHAITEADAQAEGVEKSRCGQAGYEMEPLYSYRTGFVRIWREINGPDSWAKNPWIWRVEFKRLETR